jgi:hypothetical protein
MGSTDSRRKDQSDPATASSRCGVHTFVAGWTLARIQLYLSPDVRVAHFPAPGKWRVCSGGVPGLARRQQEILFLKIDGNFNAASVRRRWRVQWNKSTLFQMNYTSPRGNSLRRSAGRGELFCHLPQRFDAAGAGHKLVSRPQK